MFLRVSPESMGLPDGEKSELKQANGRPGDAESEDDGIGFHQALKGRFFWGLSLAYIFLMVPKLEVLLATRPCEGATFRSRNSNCGRDLTCI